MTASRYQKRVKQPRRFQHTKQKSIADFVGTIEQQIQRAHHNQQHGQQSGEQHRFVVIDSVHGVCGRQVEGAWKNAYGIAFIVKMGLMQHKR